MTFATHRQFALADGRTTICGEAPPGLTDVVDGVLRALNLVARPTLV